MSRIRTIKLKNKIVFSIFKILQFFINHLNLDFQNSEYTFKNYEKSNWNFVYFLKYEISTLCNGFSEIF